jgi:ParB-like chromosome segregation protein Spo0J
MKARFLGMKFDSVDPFKIQPNNWNSNVVSHENESKLKASIARHGMFKPILVRELDDGTLESVGGFHRTEQAIELGLKVVPIVNLGNISDERAKEIGLIDNARYGIDDTQLLADLLAELDKGDVETFMPWTMNDINAITASLKIDLDDLDIDQPDLVDESEEEPEKPSRVLKTHQLLRVRLTLQDGAKISNILTEIMKLHGFTKEDDLTNAGDALVHLLLRDNDDG